MFLERFDKIYKAVRGVLTKGPGGGEIPLRKEPYHTRYQLSLRQWLLYHQKEIVFGRMHWMGTQIWKNPLDAWIYQEMLYEVRPDIVIEIGSRFGGSTKYFADLLTLIGHGIVLSIDNYREDYHLVHDRVVVLTGDSSSPEILSAVAGYCSGKTAFVIQDGDHSCRQVYEDLVHYSTFVTVGSYFVVEDGIVDLFHDGDGLGFKVEGPLAAIEKFLAVNPSFTVDDSRERYLLTYSPRGFLKRIQ